MLSKISISKIILEFSKNNSSISYPTFWEKKTSIEQCHLISSPCKIVNSYFLSFAAPSLNSSLKRKQHFREPIRNWPMVISLLACRWFHAGSGSTRCSFFICRSRNCRMHGRGTRALLQEWMFSWLQEFCMNIYERPSRPGRGGWNLCFPSPLAADTSVLLSRRYAPFFSPSMRDDREIVILF